jgi:transposase
MRVGTNDAWLLVLEAFGWQKLKNRRHVGALAGLCPVPYTSGESDRDQGIAKTGNRRLRTMAVELA